MNPAALTQAQSIAHALGWTLLHFFWQGVLIALVLACLLALISQRAPQQRYFAACTALFLMIVAPVVTFTRIIATQPKAPSTFTFIALDTITVNATSTPTQPLLQRIAYALDHSMPALLSIWLAGVLFLLARLILGLYVARQMKSFNTQQPSAELLAAFQSLMHHIGVSRPVRLLHSALVQVPTVIGWLRPVVLLPFGCLTGLSLIQLEAILAHELAHIRRHDYLVTVLQTIVEALLFYHPAVWWVSRCIRFEREHCCDDLAVNIGGNPLVYARALSLLAEQSLATPAATLAANGGILTMRIKRLLSPQEGPAASQFAAVTVLALVVALAGISIGATAHAQAKSIQEKPSPTATLDSTPIPSTLIAAAATADHQEPAVPKLSGEYQQWIYQDVRYIIMPAERFAFLQLTNDADRDAFISDFWRRRDPAGSPENTARTQHYQRIAYSNQHFAEGSTPGWQTDRGRMYIVNGAPTSIDSHPTGIGDGHPYELWDYSTSKGPGQSEYIHLEFVDQCNCGIYRLEFQSQPDSAAMPRTAYSEVILVSSSDPNSPYPLIARAAHVSGEVMIQGTISKTGTMEDLQVISGPQMLRATALEVVKQKTYPLPGVKPAPNGWLAAILVNFILNAAQPDPKPSAATPQQRNPKPTVVRTSYAPPQPDPDNAPKGPARVSSDIMAAQFINGTRVNPVYPAEAKANHIEGAVVLHVIISPEGDVTNVQVVSGPEELRNGSVTAVSQWKYRPYLLNGQPKAVDTTITINYSLANDEDDRIASGALPKKIGDGVSAPIVIYMVQPKFSQAAKDAAKAGDFKGGHVLVHLIVDEQGIPQNVRVIRGVGYDLDDKAIEAVKQYKFNPGLENGQPVPVAINIEVSFATF
jgi:TonB family protein